MGRHEWKAAAEFYKQTLDNLDPTQNTLPAADIMERSARCYFKAAFQSEARTEFHNLMRISQAVHEDSGRLLEKLGSQVLAKRAKSRATYAGFWLSDNLDENRALIQNSTLLGKEIVQECEIEGKRNELAEALVDLLVYQEQALHLSSERKQLVSLFEETTDIAWRIIEGFRGIAGDDSILESINILVTMYSEAENILEPPTYQRLEKRLDTMRNTVAQISEGINTPRAQALSYETLGHFASDLEGDSPKALSLFEKGISIAKETKDNYLIGRLRTLASANARFLALNEDYGEKRREYLDKAVQLAIGAIHDLEPSCPPGIWLREAYARYVDASTLLALQVETDPDKKQALLRKTIDYTRKGMINEKYSFLPAMNHALSKATYFLATMDVSPEEKAALLTEALPLREETVRNDERLFPHSWDLGVMLNYSALLKAELSKSGEEQARRLQLLQGAARDMQQCVTQCAKITSIGTHPPAMIRVQGQYNEWHGDILQQLHAATLDTTHARLAIEAYEQAIAFLTKSDSVGPIPAVRWKIARAYDSFREYKESSQAFQKAASEYRLAGQKLPGLAPTFDEFAMYMEGWALIEDARLKHSQELYGTSADNYTEAANRLRSSKAWSHLSKLYDGCSFLELGEALSKQEKQQAAVESFKEAQSTFQDATNGIDSRLRITFQPQEKNELNDWLEITRERVKYSLGRTQLEDARILDARGEDEASSSKYRTASETFGSLLPVTRDEQTRRELESLMLLCDAWAKMKNAEAGSLPELYAEAADNFAKIERTGFGKSFQLAALANASMCKALEAGTLFRRTRDKGLYTEIKKQLETAADFYEEAGIKRATGWTRATQRFFDALTFLGDAEAQTDPRKKAEFYDLAEKQLQLAASLYGDTGYSRKKEETLSLLKRARVEKELLLTPMEVLDESAALRETALTPLSFTPDHAMGLERFEAANVVGNIVMEGSVLREGSEIVLQLEMANIGKTAATLLKIENTVQEGLQLVRDKIDERIEDGYIDMRGRRIDYLKTSQVKVTVRAKRKGVYQVRPRVHYVDERGVYRLFEFEPSRILVTDVEGEAFVDRERRLSAIMFTDIVGYTTLTEQNESLALELLEEHRRVLRPLFPRYTGREIKTVGDMFLVEFASALEAVRCAMRIQEALVKRNLECSEARRVHLRIGIHVGDVEHSHGDVYGEAVNTASRIEPLASPDGIVVTRQVYDQIRNRPGIMIQPLGARELKNVKEPLEVFSILP